MEPEKDSVDPCAEEVAPMYHRDEKSVVTILAPDHPKMKKFQDALTKYLNNTKKSLCEEIASQKHEISIKRSEKTSVGCHLHERQKTLRHEQDNTERIQRELESTRLLGVEEEANFNKLKEAYEQYEEAFQRKKIAESRLRDRKDSLAERVMYLKLLFEDTDVELAHAKRTLRKTESSFIDNLLQKQKQDLYLGKLSSEMIKLETQIRDTEEEIEIQENEYKAIRKQIVEANSDCEALRMEKAQLIHGWQSSLVTLRARQTVHNEIRKVIAEETDGIKLIGNEINACKKLVTKEMMDNELLTINLNKVTMSHEESLRALEVVKKRQNSLLEECHSTQLFVEDVERSLGSESLEHSLMEDESEKKRRELEIASVQKVELRDEYTTKLQEKISEEKSAEYALHKKMKNRDKMTELECILTKFGEDVAKKAVRIADLEFDSRLKTDELAVLESVSKEKEAMLQRLEYTIKQNETMILKKQEVYDKLTKQLNTLIAYSGGFEMAPLQANIMSLQKKIDKTMQDTSNMEDFWLRLQNDLVCLTKERINIDNQLDSTDKKCMILEERRQRVQRDIDTLESDIKDINKATKEMEKILGRIQHLVYNEKDLETNLKKTCDIQQQTSLLYLKEKEEEILTLEELSENINREIVQGKQLLSEHEEGRLLWDRKVHFAKEFKCAAQKEEEGELGSMRSELRKMQLHLNEVEKCSEGMMRKLEGTIVVRESIASQADKLERYGLKEARTKSMFNRQIETAKKRIICLQKDQKDLSKSLKQSLAGIKSLQDVLNMRQEICKQLQNHLSELDQKAEALSQSKFLNTERLSLLYLEQKHCNNLRDGKYRLLHKDEDKLRSEWQKKEDYVNDVDSVLQKIQSEFPGTGPDLAKIGQLMKSDLLV